MKTRVDVQVTITGAQGSGKTTVSRALAQMIRRRFDSYLALETPFEFEIFSVIPKPDADPNSDDFSFYVEFDKP